MARRNKTHRTDEVGVRRMLRIACGQRATSNWTTGGKKRNENCKVQRPTVPFVSCLADHPDFEDRMETV